MFERLLTSTLQEAVQMFYAVALLGPRQSGKTTLLQMLFPEYRYLNLEDPETLAKVQGDPKGYLDKPDSCWILDEAQEYPEIFSYLLSIIDKNKKKGQFILSGSKNFTLLEQISQSLAGRVAILELLPLSYSELCSNSVYTPPSIWHLIYQGGYPGVYAESMRIDLWYKSYVMTYLQRDVRQLIQVKDLSKFHLFLKLCAGRHGQLLNMTELGSACGMSHSTIHEWLSVLEASYIVFRLPPYYQNFNKRLIKTPKLYFYDAGLVCYLLGIESPEHAEIHAARGALFEGFVISEIMKFYLAEGKTMQLYFWNHQPGFEVDVLLEKQGIIHAFEIKSSSTFAENFLSQLKKWETLCASAKQQTQSRLIYSGVETDTVRGYSVISYRDIEKCLKGI